MSVAHDPRSEWPALAFVDLSLGYDRTPVVRNLTATISRGTLTAIVGSNGSGKSTLLRGIVGELRPLHGRVVMPNTIPEEIAYLVQDVQLELGFPMRVLDMVAMGLWREIGAFGSFSARHFRRVEAVLDQVGLSGYARHSTSSLSLGQLRRALFARMLLQDAELLLLDEPFATVDATTSAELWRLVQRLRDDGKTIVIVTHDVELARQDCDDVLLLENGLVVQGHPSQVLAGNRLHAMLGDGDRPDTERGHPDISDLPRAA